MNGERYHAVIPLIYFFTCHSSIKGTEKVEHVRIEFQNTRGSAKILLLKQLFKEFKLSPEP